MNSYDYTRNEGEAASAAALAHTTRSFVGLGEGVLKSAVIHVRS